ncbi:Glycosyl hydrolase, family 13, catalytic domain protein [Kalmanozyma brasiliensis GHG001]|uniref:Alpha-glucosidase n=1 Tax=Kalmanozyma brasiliensis (strain GHG001) TaxID=1365824 RepID=V5EUM0_KALBG|nr:Glycosyl hydrolase, family 13, catalytic domain protein [Kalmanozyma brasiliensis GHG001]EST06878.1 Glycosyl hydrolase, family 13, catalytic domain protein [Kalmanozyma brasiliensis GHG001]
MSAKDARTFWFRDAVVYQIWPASYKDSNNDGIGDIQGIISTLDYVKSLGVNTIWLSPMYDSPQVDMGYDISDYQNVYPPYGTLQDMEELIRECLARGIKLILDLVINHTSDQHAWFQESKKNKDNPKRDWYIWRPAKYDAETGERIPPNNWRGALNQSAWTWDEATQEYYLHLFTPQQPDLNWTNDECRRTLYTDTIEFWLKKGINGFRVDTVNLYSKPMDFPDAPITDPDAKWQIGDSVFCNGPRMHEYLQEMGAIFAKYDAMTVGELPATPNVEDVIRYISAERSELSEIFQFDISILGRSAADFYATHPYTLKELKEVVERWQRFVEGTDAWPTVFLENHDLPRAISKYASDKPEHIAASGKMLALMETGLTGTLYLYQGQEIGMTNVPTTWSHEEYKDVIAINYYRDAATRSSNDPTVLKKTLEDINRQGRDNARTPMQWTAASNGGFSTDASTVPWMRANDNYTSINVAAQEDDEESVLAFYRKALAVRKQYASLLGRGEFRLLERDDQQVFKYVKIAEGGKDGDAGARAFAVLNFSDMPQEYQVPEEAGGSKARVLLGSLEDGQPGKLRAWEGRMYVYEP